MYDLNHTYILIYIVTNLLYIRTVCCNDKKIVHANLFFLKKISFDWPIFVLILMAGIKNNLAEIMVPYTNWKPII
jgi:hypothetical protein